MIQPRILSTEAQRLLRKTIARQGGLWPSERHRAIMEAEWKTSTISPKPGTVLLVGVRTTKDGQQGVLLECDLGEGHVQGPRHPEWRDDAMGALHRAHTAALKHTLGASSPPPGRKDEAWVLRLSEDCGDGPLDGGSYGLPLFLATVSHWLKRPLPPHICASGRLDGERVASVGGLQAKLDVIADLAPGVRMFLVPPGGRSQIQAHHESIEVREVSTLQECLELANLVPPDITADDVDGLNDWFASTQLAELDDVLTRSAIRGAFPEAGYQPYVHAAKWRLHAATTPAADMAAHPRSKHSTFTTSEYVGQLSAHAILRHCGQQASGALDVGALDKLPYALRTMAVAHMIQSARDLGNPDIESVAVVADRLLQDTHVDEFAALAAEHSVLSVSNRHAEFLLRSALDLDRQQMMVAGAYARLIAADSKRIAFAAWLNWALCKAWLENLEPDQTSMPAGELFRLAALPAHVSGSDTARLLRDDLLNELGGIARAINNPWHAQHLLSAADVFSENPSEEMARGLDALSNCTSLGPLHRLIRKGAAYRMAQPGCNSSATELASNHGRYQRALKKKRGESHESAASMLCLLDAQLDKAAYSDDELAAALACIRTTDFATVYYAEKYFEGNIAERVSYVLTFSPY